MAIGKGRLLAIRRLIPSSPCEPGCTDCCCPVPFSQPEWDRVPEKFKKGLDIRRTESFFGRTMWLPCKPDFLPKGFGDFIPQRHLSSAMRAGTLDEQKGDCPFVSQKNGCLIYDERPIICRLYGTSMIFLLRCNRGLTTKSLLTDAEVKDITKRWYLL